MIAERAYLGWRQLRGSACWRAGGQASRSECKGCKGAPGAQLFLAYATWRVDSGTKPAQQTRKHKVNKFIISFGIKRKGIEVEVFNNSVLIEN